MDPAIHVNNLPYQSSEIPTERSPVLVDYMRAASRLPFRNHTVRRDVATGVVRYLGDWAATVPPERPN